MVLIGGNQIYTDPRTDEHLRTVLARAQQNETASSGSITTLEATIALHEAIIGYEDATYVSTTVIGQPLYIAGADSVDLADASVVGTSNVIGLCYVDTLTTVAGQYITHGIITQTSWLTVLGSIKLTAGTKYYLSETAGLLTATPPTTVGAYVVEIGTALDLETLNVNIRQRVKL